MYKIHAYIKFKNVPKCLFFIILKSSINKLFKTKKS